MFYSHQTVSDVAAGSPAARAGIVRGDTLVSINDQPVCDLVDYEYLTAAPRLTVCITDGGGQTRTLTVRKNEYEPFGLSFATTLMDNMRTCRNRCMFCFIDQMPQGVRTSLHVKDDDWRMSFIMGNYVTLTNVPPQELDRIIARRVSPLYISLHATDPAVRVRMMKNPRAGEILPQLVRLRDAGLRFHLQIVLCPNENDGAVLEKTLADVETLLPAAQSVAIVPVGLTRFREGLTPLRPFTPDEARALIDAIEPRQQAYRRQYGTRLVFLSDEWYLLGDRALPPSSDYEDFPQIENGVGLLRLFEDEFIAALAEYTPRPDPVRFAAAGGTAANPFMRALMTRLAPYGVSVECFAVENRYFGGNVNVGGLVTGGDLIGTLRDRLDGRTLLLPRNMLRERGNVFLDNVTLKEAETALHTRIRPFFDAAELIQIVMEGDKNA